MIHWLWFHAGLSNGNSPWYLFLSGACGDFAYLSVVVAILSAIKKNNCHHRWCWRYGHHVLKDPASGLSYQLCRKHHPDHPGRHLTGEIVRVVHSRRNRLGSHHEQ